MNEVVGGEADHLAQDASCACQQAAQAIPLSVIVAVSGSGCLLKPNLTVEHLVIATRCGYSLPAWTDSWVVLRRRLGTDFAGLPRNLSNFGSSVQLGHRSARRLETLAPASLVGLRLHDLLIEWSGSPLQLRDGDS